MIMRIVVPHFFLQ